MGIRKFSGDLVNARGVNAKTLGSGQRLARNFQQHAIEDGIRHVVSIILTRGDVISQMLEFSEPRGILTTVHTP